MGLNCHNENGRLCHSLLLSEPTQAFNETKHGMNGTTASYREMLLTSNEATCTVEVRTTQQETHFWAFPPATVRKTEIEKDGVFSKFVVNVTKASLTHFSNATVQLIKEAGEPRQ